MKIYQVGLSKGKIFSCGCLFFFICIFIGIIFDNTFSWLVKYSGYFVGAVLGIVSIKGRMNIYEIILLATIIVGSAFSYNWSRNGTYGMYIYILVSFFVGLFLWNKSINPQSFLVVLYMNVAFAFYNFTLHGTAGQIYAQLSNNFVSYHVLAPACIYYSLADIRRKEIPWIPAAVTWITCLFAQGRGGIIVATILFGGVLYYAFRYQMTTSFLDKLLIGMICLLFLGSVAFFVSNYSSIIYQYKEVFGHFAKRGIDSVARIEMWRRYLSFMISDWRDFLWGVDLHRVGFIASRLNYNLHNSFLNIHAYSGMFPFICICFLTCKSFRYANQKDYRLFMICFFAFLLRCATDRIFWGNDGTAILIFFLVMPFRDYYLVNSLKYRERNTSITSC